jgi:hypothetical protein
MILPFRHKVYKSTLNFNEIFVRLQEKTHAPIENFDIAKMIDRSDIFEMKHDQSSFVIGKGTGILKYGKFSTFPVIVGKLKKKNCMTYVYIKIRPKSFFSPIFGLLFIVPAIYFGIHKADFSLLGTAFFLLMMLYLDIATKFNKAYKFYLDIIEGTLGNGIS